MLIIYLYATYVVVNKVFLVPRERREPKLLFVILILIFALLYFIYHEIALLCTKFIINNTKYNFKAEYDNFFENFLKKNF